MDIHHIILSLILVVAFLLMNAFFVIAEFAIVRVRKSQIELAVEEGKKGAKRALLVVNNVNAYLSACQLGITLASLALGWLGEPVFAALIRPIFQLFNAPEVVISTGAIAVGYFLMTTLHVVVGELIPKSFAIFSTEKYALHTSTLLFWFYRITYPIMWLFNSITNGVVRLMGHSAADEHDVYTGDEIKLLVDESTESGLIDPDQNEYLDNILDLKEKDAATIMKPRPDVIFIDINDSSSTNLEIVQKYSYSRYPVIDGDADHLVGFVHVKDLLNVSSDIEMGEWPIRELVAVPETCSISNLLHELSEKRTEICAVVDEHGGTCGIATLSDVVSQIVGRIDDEYRHVAEAEVKELRDGSLEIDGGMPIGELCEIIGFEPEGAENVETAAGLVMRELDKIPNEGDKAFFSHESTQKKVTITMMVLHMDNLRIDRILLTVDQISN